MFTIFPISNQKKKRFRVGMYIRLSREDGDKLESTSITNQRDIITRYISENENLTLIKEYVDDGYTGTNFERPAFKNLIEDIENNIIDMVITKDMSRLGRNFIQTGHYLQEYFPDKRVRYVAILDNIDTLEDEGMSDIAPFKAVLNDMYSKDISNKIKSVLHEKKKNGQFVGTTAPYGYEKDPENKYQLIVKKDEAKIVQKIFELYLQGNGLTKIAKILTEEDVPVPILSRNNANGRKTALYYCWKQTTISRILRNPVYIGNLPQLKRRKLNYKSKKRVQVDKEDWLIVENMHEAIIDKATFNKVQGLLENNKSFKATKHDYLFKGLLFCADCDSRLMITYSNYALKKYNEYRYTTICYTHSKLYNKCTRHSNRMSDLEEVLLESIRKVCKDYMDEDISSKLLRIAEESKRAEIETFDKEKEMENINREIREINEYLTSLYKDKVRKIITDEEYMRLSLEFKEEKDKLLSKRAELEKMDEEENFDFNNKQAKKIINEFLSMKNPTKELINQLVEKITISEQKEITIYFKFNELNVLQRQNDLNVAV